MGNPEVKRVGKKAVEVKWWKRGRWFWLVVGLGVVWQCLFFYLYPKQAWMDGLTEAWFLNKGLAMYRDFSNEYPPFLFLIMWPLHLVFGFSQMTTVWLSLVNSVGLFLLVSFFSYKYLSGWYKYLPVLFYLFWEPLLAENHFTTMSFENTVLFVAFMLWWSDWRKGSLAKAFGSGLLFGVATMSTQLALPITGVVGLSYIVRVVVRRVPVRVGLGWFAGAILPGVFVLSWLWSNGIIREFWYWNWDYYFFGYPYASSFGRGVDNIIFFVGVFSPTVLVFLAGFMSFLGRDERRGECSSLNLLFWFLALIVQLILFWFAIFHPNRFLMSLAILAFTFGWGVEWFLKKRRGREKLIGWLVLGMIVCLAFLSFVRVGFNKYRWGFSYPRQYNLLTDTYKGDPLLDVIDWIKRETPPDARLFAMTDNAIYPATDRLPAGARANTSLPMIYRPISDFSKELRQRPPDYWVIDERQWKRWHDFGEDEVTEFLQKGLACEPVVAKFEYITIREHSGKKWCF